MNKIQKIKNVNVIDRVESGKYVRNPLGKAITKATSRELIGPKQKHVEFITRAIESDTVVLSDVANQLFERSRAGNWIIVFKSLITTHQLMATANERFIQHVASSRSTTWMLDNFLDKGGTISTDMSYVVRRYSAYMTEKAYSYRTAGMDFCRAERGRESGVLRNADAGKLLSSLPAIQRQLDSLIQVEIVAGDLSNGVITAAFVLLYKDLVRLFACYNDGIINLIEKFFALKKMDCRSALDMYKKFLSRISNVSEILKVAKEVGIDQGGLPELSPAPSSLLTALEEHLQALERGGKPAVVAGIGQQLTAQFPSFDFAAKGPAPKIPVANSSTSPAETNGFHSASEGSIASTEQQSWSAFDEHNEQEQSAIITAMAASRSLSHTEASAEAASNTPKPVAYLQRPPAVQSRNAVSHSELLNGLATQHQSASQISSPQIAATSSTPNMVSTPNNAAGTPVRDRRPSEDILQLNSAFNAHQPVGGINFNAAFNNPPTDPASSHGAFMDNLLQPELPQGQDHFGSITPPNEKVNNNNQTPDLNQSLMRAAKSLDCLDFTPKVKQQPLSFNKQESKGKTGGQNFQGTGVALSTYTTPLVPQGQQNTNPFMQQPMIGMPTSPGQQMNGQQMNPFQQQQQPVMMGGQQRSMSVQYGMSQQQQQQHGMYNGIMSQRQSNTNPFGL